MQVPIPVVLSAILVLAVLIAILLAAAVRRLRRSDGNTANEARTALVRLEERLGQLASISDRVDELTRIFSVPRTRGEVGETVLAELLRTYLPPTAFELQHTFSDGRRVDAIVKLGDSLVPIDAKFPLEALRRHIEQHPEATQIPPSISKVFVDHARSISERYIRSDERTIDFALMYVPSEGIYHRIFVADSGETMKDVLGLRVLPVSPGTLYLYLLTVAYALRGAGFSSEAADTIDRIRSVRKAFDELSRTDAVVRTHVKNLYKALDESESKAATVDRALGRLERQ